MVKNNLREAGYAEETKYQKRSAVTATWIVLTLAMTVFVFVFTVIITQWKASGSDFADFVDDV